MFDRHAATPNARAAVLVCLDFGSDAGFADSMEEIVRLAMSAGVTTHVIVQGKRQRPDAALFAGSGKVEEIHAAAEAIGAGTVIFNHRLSPVQERNLEKKLERAVMDRTRLILEIFARRARTHEGKLQVELAQMEYLSTRLIRGWTHLERQRGGIGLRGGPGETQLELDRRLISQRIRTLKAGLEKMRQRRDVQRRARARKDVFSVSLVGYTNAGKSTLFNALTHAKGYTADQLFATLDTTTRRIFLSEMGDAAGSVVVSDTVGFIRDLPTSLIAAFRATLEETAQADLLLHVVDSASPARDMRIAEVNKVLAEIGADRVPQVLVLNKIDLAAGQARSQAGAGVAQVAGMAPGLDRDEYGKIFRIRVSARAGFGIAELRGAIAELAPAHLRARVADFQPDPQPNPNPSIHPELA